MPEETILHVCHLEDGGPPVHPCRRAIQALDAAGITYSRNVFDRNRPFGLFTKGRRPELKQISGQEKLPVLELPDGTTVNGSGDIIAWARAHADPTAATAEA
ncbi:MAG TPA: glutathione S-transferase N-terminal domain-containing protein [Solirubrobacteraceae bacterium]|nr:glutathione S-transferase N-terminal domain-containing protein [Solirubrobacteraceae bacterium]